MKVRTVALASDYISADESAVVLMGDDFMYNPDGSSEVARLIAATPAGELDVMVGMVILAIFFLFQIREQFNSLDIGRMEQAQKAHEK